MRSLAVLALAVSFPLVVHAADLPSLPDPIMTPGAVDHSVTRDVVCNGTTRERRHVSTATKAEVLAAYNIPDAESPYYEIDHLVPLAIGGGNVVTNLWPEPWAEAVQKDVLEVELQRRVFHGLLSQIEAQREIADDWTAAYERYVGGTLVVAPDAAGPVAKAAPVQRTIRERIAAAAWRWAWKRIVGAP